VRIEKLVNYVAMAKLRWSTFSFQYDNIGYEVIKCKRYSEVYHVPINVMTAHWERHASWREKQTAIWRGEWQSPAGYNRSSWLRGAHGPYSTDTKRQLGFPYSNPSVFYLSLSFAPSSSSFTSWLQGLKGPTKVTQKAVLRWQQHWS